MTATSEYVLPGTDTLIREKTPRYGNRHRIGEEVLQGLVRHVRTTFEICRHGNQLRSEEPGFSDFRRQRNGVEALAMSAPIPVLTKFRNDEGLVDEFDLLTDFQRIAFYPNWKRSFDGL